MIEAYTDAASGGDPGPSAAGVVIKKKNQVYEFPKYLGTWSNHEAEFLAIIHALEVCVHHFPDEIISIRSDSKTAVETIEKNFTKNGKFLPLLERIQTLQASFPFVFYKWIPEKQNRNADRVAKQCLIQHESLDH
ncbi:ribonuclease HI family protein [Halobacillus sp. ACCC02827]|uniref:ribonuclease HI family protein n=1 Tax=Bacillaceae TaxID=186817 RepID=UPI0002A509FD|nr:MULTISPECIES: ribonuclease HI family protein [Bacillaceae]ELK44175.1 ribonuclease H [Halobacillus sp. BAB-2008]QHT46823.1 ribonuclease HI family protein [Bacillus sp. SB49]WJE14044.1 ribonuclease HI family protein [Halobacillus sp. ACCC02827]